MAYKHPYDHFTGSSQLDKGLYTIRAGNTSTFSGINAIEELERKYF